MNMKETRHFLAGDILKKREGRQNERKSSVDDESRIELKVRLSESSS